MYRVLSSPNRFLAECIRRSILNPIRAASTTEPGAGSVASDPGAFGTKEKSEEARWIRRQEAEQVAKRQTQPDKSSQGKQDVRSFAQQRLDALEAEKKNIEQEIAELKRQLH